MRARFVPAMSSNAYVTCKGNGAFTDLIPISAPGRSSSTSSTYSILLHRKLATRSTQVPTANGGSVRVLASRMPPIELVSLHGCIAKAATSRGRLFMVNSACTSTLAAPSCPPLYVLPRAPWRMSRAPRPGQAIAPRPR